eukprot:TRINITY_DN1784_c0_g1_i7.p2 TRINITY_DN1784_c0_g1~~TRINITY_DN1784_c0_g1_i7.p2  ORF type:complete len:225 (-),score=60.84 TRINITY_DN1784_c0_g1_i7:1051-1725(-)
MTITFQTSGNLPLVLFAAIVKTSDVFDGYNGIGSDSAPEDRAVAYISLYLAVWSAISWSWGNSMFAREKANQYKPTVNMHLEDNEIDLREGGINEGSSQSNDEVHVEMDVDIEVADRARENEELDKTNRWKQILSPPVIGTLVGILIGMIPFMKRYLLNDPVPVWYAFVESAQLISGAFLPSVMLVLGASPSPSPSLCCTSVSSPKMQSFESCNEHEEEEGGGE